MPTLRRALTLVETLVVIAIGAVLIGLLLPAVQAVRAAAVNTRCQNNLKQIGLALQNYHAAANVLPPGLRTGKDAEYPFLSWLARLLPYLEHDALWHETIAAYGEDRVFTHNPPHTGLSTPVALFVCPADGRGLYVQSAGPYPSVALSNYLGCTGKNLFSKSGVLFRNSVVRLSDVTDGTSHTLAAGERPTPPDFRFGWWYGGGGQAGTGSLDSVLGVRDLNITVQAAAACGRGPFAFVPGKLDELCDMFHYWSLHAGGANFLMCDGSVRFMTYASDGLLPALATRAGGDSAD